jgi:hypothetical protein
MVTSGASSFKLRLVTFALNALREEACCIENEIFTWEIISAFVIVERQIQQTVSSLTAWLTVVVVMGEGF